MKRTLPKKMGMFYAFFVILLFNLTANLQARPYAAGLESSERVEFQRWNQDLESPVKHPLEGFKKPYWKNQIPKYEKGLKDYQRSLIRPLRDLENGIGLNMLYLTSGGLDQQLGFSNTGAGLGAGFEFDTRDFAFELTSSFPAFNYNFFANYLNFSNDDEISGSAGGGINLAFGAMPNPFFKPLLVNNGKTPPNDFRIQQVIGVGTTQAAYTGVAKTDLGFLRIGNIRDLGRKKESRFSILSGLSYLDFDRLQRVRGTGVVAGFESGSRVLKGNSNVAVVPDPAATVDPITINQGQEIFRKKGPGAFFGFQYLTHLGNNLLMNAKTSAHLMSVDQDVNLSVRRVSQSSLLETYTSNTSGRQSDVILDFEWGIQKYVRHFYNLSLGFRYIQFMEGEERQMLGNVKKDSFHVKGIQFSFKRFF